MRDMEKYTDQTFHVALGELLRNKYGDTMGRYSITPFIQGVAKKTGLSHEYIRLMLKDERPLRTDVIEAAAETLGIEAHYFLEYRVSWVHWQMEHYPEITNKLHDVARALVKSMERSNERAK
jgi:hypothetical protein